MKPQSIVFLGGTCGNNKWRPKLIQDVQSSFGSGDNSVLLFDPVVDDWNEAAQAKEEEMKAAASLHVYYLASPKLASPTDVSAYSLLEAAMALYDHPTKSLVVFDNSEIEGHSRKAMDQALRVLKKRFPTQVLGTYEELVETLVHRIFYKMI